MKKTFFILVVLLAFVTINSHLKAQDVSFGSENKSGNSLYAKVVCTQAATVTFELQTSSSLEYKWANYRVWGVNYAIAYCTVQSPGKRIDYMTVGLPKGESNIQIDGSKATAVMIVSTVNGNSANTRPIVVTFD
jgi:hypothetical protein